jgi:uracil-DNA glycosylase
MIMTYLQLSNKCMETSLSRNAANELDFSDSDSDTDFSDQEHMIVKKKKIKKIIVKQDTIIGTLPSINYIVPDAKNYCFKDWSECFPDNRVNLWSLIFTERWGQFFDMASKKPYFATIEKMLSETLAAGKVIVPRAELVFNVFNTMAPEDIKVVIMGQDPYPGGESVKGNIILHATGIAFSGPHHLAIPRSCSNIFANLKTYGHIKNLPPSGCLSGWMTQGCFLFNSALTTLYGQSKAHQTTWALFAEDLINYLSTSLDGLVFVVWGASANKICKNVDPKKHRIITSSHPSPYSVDNEVRGYVYGECKIERQREMVMYPSFRTVNHFGRINAHLENMGKTPIIWDLEHSIDDKFIEALQYV